MKKKCKERTFFLFSFLCFTIYVNIVFENVVALVGKKG